MKKLRLKLKALSIFLRNLENRMNPFFEKCVSPRAKDRYEQPK